MASLNLGLVRIGKDRWHSESFLSSSITHYPLPITYPLHNSISRFEGCLELIPSFTVKQSFRQYKIIVLPIPILFSNCIAIPIPIPIPIQVLIALPIPIPIPIPILSKA